MAAHNELGKWGEDMAEVYLRNNGYIILERDWHSGHRDIDIIAIEGCDVVFVEVKTRRNNDFIEPEQNVNYKKLQNLRLAINHYVKYRHIDKHLRFDIITIIGNIGSIPEINHIKEVPII